MQLKTGKKGKRKKKKAKKRKKEVEKNKQVLRERIGRKTERKEGEKRRK